MSNNPRKIELQVEVVGTPEEVWRAIATGPGISSWYVPHVVEEREGGAATASFGPGPEMQISGRVAAWEPPHRIVFDKGKDADGLAFEWLIEAREGGTCVVRLVNSGFGSGEPWDAQYDGMVEGWKLFLSNLRLHLEHFRGQTAMSMLPMAMWVGTRSEAWARLTDALAIPAAPASVRGFGSMPREFRLWPGPSSIAHRHAWCSCWMNRRKAPPLSPSRGPEIRSVFRSGPTSTAPTQK